MSCRSLPFCILSYDHLIHLTQEHQSRLTRSYFQYSIKRRSTTAHRQQTRLHTTMSSQPKPAAIASEVEIFKTKAAAKRGVGAIDGQTETIWPKPEFVGSSSPSIVNTGLMKREHQRKSNSSLKQARKLVVSPSQQGVCFL
jgi:hypothetical protein